MEAESPTFQRTLNRKVEVFIESLARAPEPKLRRLWDPKGDDLAILGLLHIYFAELEGLVSGINSNWHLDLTDTDRTHVIRHDSSVTAASKVDTDENDKLISGMSTDR